MVKWPTANSFYVFQVILCGCLQRKCGQSDSTWSICIHLSHGKPQQDVAVYLGRLVYSSGFCVKKFAFNDNRGIQPARLCKAVIFFWSPSMFLQNWAKLQIVDDEQRKSLSSQLQGAIATRLFSTSHMCKSIFGGNRREGKRR